MQNRAIEYFKKFDLQKGTNNWYYFSCPFCTRTDNRLTACVIFNTKPRFKCWSCNEDGQSIWDFVMTFENLSNYSQTDRFIPLRHEYIPLNTSDEIDTYTINKRVNKTVSFLPPGMKSLFSTNEILVNRARDYLTKRGFDVNNLAADGWCFCNDFGDWHGYIIIPVKSMGKLIYYIGRDFTGLHKLKYKNPKTELIGIGKSEILYNQDALFEQDKIYLVEGVFDALTLGKKGVASFGWKLSKIQVDMLVNSAVKEIIMVPDQGTDKKGNTFYRKAMFLAEEIMERTNKKIKIIQIAGGKDANEVGAQAVFDIENKSIYLNDSIINAELYGF